MRPRVPIALIMMLSFFASAIAQQQTSGNQTGQSKEKQDAAAKKGDVVRVSVTLVQTDVTVTDSKGRPVTDLKAEDFEVLQNNKPQQITNFSFIGARPSDTNAPASATNSGERKSVEPPAPPPSLRPGNVRRTLALVVDDLTLSFESTALVRAALKKFVDEQMKPGDLVAVIRTGAGMGALQQFTNDKRQLYAAIERVRWSPKYAAVNTFSPIQSEAAIDLRKQFDPDAVVNTRGKAVDQGGPHSRDLDGTFDRISRDRNSYEIDQFRKEVFAVGTLGAIDFLIRGMNQLPGRKSVVMFSDALRIYNREEGITRVQVALDHLIDRANRASVVVYTVDARGLQTLGITAADDISGDLEQPAPASISDYSKHVQKRETAIADRIRDFNEAQDGLRYLADRTGGVFTRNTNDLSRGVDRALKEQEEYYLVGFVPDEDTFKSKKGGREFHNITIRVKRPGLRVRTRKGFYAIADEEKSSVNISAARQLLTALASPFNSGDIGLKMAAQFWQDPKGGAFINALIHIDARDISFEETVNGWRKATFEIAAFTFGENGQVIDRGDKAYSVSMSEKDYLRTLESGIFYRINLPIKKPGAYQLRTAVRDFTSKKVGSANQFIEIPDAKRNRLVLSGIVVRGVDSSPASTSRSSAAARQASDNSEGKVEETDPQANPAARRFKRGKAIEYGYVIYNAQASKSNLPAQLETQVRLYREGQLVYEGKMRAFDAAGQTDFKRLIAGGSLLLGSELVPGEYALQVVVVDKTRKEKDRLATQWIDFELVGAQ